jgi:protein TonB
MSTRWTAPALFASLLATLCLPPLVVPLAAGEEPAQASEAEFVPPQVILSTQKQPVYPPAALAARYTGSVLVQLRVLKDGTVGEAKVVACSRPKVGFEEAATAALEQWRFEPALLDGQPIDIVTRLKLNFSRVGVGVDAKALVSAGSFTTDEPGSATFGSASRAGSSPGTEGK